MRWLNPKIGTSAIWIVLLVSVSCSPNTPKPASGEHVTSVREALVRPLGSEQSEAVAPIDAERNSVPIELQDVDGQSYQAFLKRQIGRVVVVDMWATWCPPCVKEFPGLVALSKKYSPEQLTCVSLCLDHQGIDDIEQVKRDVLGFLRKQDARFDNLFSVEESDVMLEHLGVRSIPVVDVYNSTGNRVRRFDQSTGKDFHYSDVELVVEELLKEPNSRTN